MSRRFLGIVLGAVMALSVASTALAGSCANLSRPPAACGFTCTSLVVEGNWVWLAESGRRRRARSAALLGIHRTGRSRCGPDRSPLGRRQLPEWLFHLAARSQCLLPQRR